MISERLINLAGVIPSIIKENQILKKTDCTLLNVDFCEMHMPLFYRLCSL